MNYAIDLIRAWLVLWPNKPLLADCPVLGPAPRG